MEKIYGSRDSQISAEMNKFRRCIICIGEKILHWISSDSETEAAIGDIEEIYPEIVSSKGRILGTLWCGFQIVKSILNQIYVSIYWSLIMLNNYLKIAVRNIKKYKAYSAINILGLAVGMACCILILLWVQDVTTAFTKMVKISTGSFQLSAAKFGLQARGHFWRI